VDPGVADSKIREGLNNSGLFFEELVGVELLKEKRFTALKEERAYSYIPAGYKDAISGTADYVGFYWNQTFSGGAGTVFGIECKKVNVAKDWLFIPMKEDGFANTNDTPNYILQLETTNDNRVSRRSGIKKYLSPGSLTIKAFEMRDSGKVYQNNDEKIFNACRQAIRATNGLFLNDEEVGLEVFDRVNGSINILRYVPLVVTNARISIAEIDTSHIDAVSGEMENNEGFKTKKVGWVYHVVNLLPEERSSLSMELSSGERAPVTPIRAIVPIVNINHIDDFLRAYKDYSR